MTFSLIFLGLALQVTASSSSAENEPTEPDPPPSEPMGSATEEDPEAPLAAPFDIRNNDRLIGDAWGLRRELETRGIDLSLSMTNVYQRNLRGGANTHRAHDITGSYDLEVYVDLGALGLLPGGAVYALAEGSWNDGISNSGDVGDLFGVNGDVTLGDRSIDVIELWYEQSWLDDKLRVRLGKMDVTLDFDTNAFANDETAQFLNYALVINGAIPYPWRGLGAQFIATPLDAFYFGAAVVDAQADDRETGFAATFHGEDSFFGMFEFGFTPVWQTRRGELPGNYRFGLWYDPQRKERFVPVDEDEEDPRPAPGRTDDLGFYTSFDQWVFRERPDLQGDGQGLGLFFRYGFAHGDVNIIQNFWSVGWQYQGLVPTRDNDVLGFGAAQGLLSPQLRHVGWKPRRETVLEVYYRIEAFPWLQVTPDFQWILNPGGESGDDAFVAGVRVQMAF